MQVPTVVDTSNNLPIIVCLEGDARVGSGTDGRHNRLGGIVVKRLGEKMDGIQWGMFPHKAKLIYPRKGQDTCLMIIGPEPRAS